MTNHIDLIAALRIPMDVTLRRGAPELDEYDEQRKAAADALEDAWAEVTAAYGNAYEVAKSWFHNVGKGTPYAEIEAITPQSARDWLAAHDAEVYRRGQEDMRERAATACAENTWRHIGDDAYSRGLDRGALEQASACAAHIRAIPIKEKDDE